MSLRKLGGNSAAYYTNYVAESGERPGEWMGEGAAALGLKGKVDPLHLKNLAAGLYPDGSEQLTGVSSIRKDRDHVAAWDATLSVPKDASALPGLFREIRPKFDRNGLEAARQVVKYIEENLAFVRRGRGGKYLEACKLIAAVFLHVTSRNNDPQWHFHLVILNAGKHKDGYGTIVSRFLYENQSAIERVFRAALAVGLKRELGIELLPVGPKPFELGEAFNIRGVPDDLRRLFSSRRAEILTALAARGDTSGRSSEAANLATRKAKTHALLKELEERWRQAAVGIGVDLAAMKREVFRPSTRQTATQSTVPTAIEAAPRSSPTEVPKPRPSPSMVSDLPERRAVSRLDPPTAPSVVPTVTPSNTETPLQTPQTLEQSKTIAASMLHSVIRSAAANKLGDPVVDRLIDDALEIADRKWGRKLPVDSAAEVAAAVRALPELLKAAEAMQRNSRHTVAPDKIKLGLFGQLTSREADVALVKTLSEPTAVACVDARWGADATLFVGALAERYREAGLKVRVFTPTASSASELESAVAAPVHTTNQLLSRLKSTPTEILKHHAVQILRAAADKPTFDRWQFDEQTVVVVTQAQTLKTAQLRQIVDEAKASGAKVVLVGSTDHLVRREPHNAFTELAGRVGKASLAEPAVPAEEWAADAVRQVSRGDVRGALSQYALAERLHLARDQKAATTELADHWRTLPRSEQNGKTLMIAGSDRDARVLNALAHHHRKASGGLGLLLKQKVDKTWVRRGDRVLFRIGSKHHGFRAGDFGTIERIGLNGMRVKLDRKHEIKFMGRPIGISPTVRVEVPKNLYRGLTLGYAVSAADAQGVTCERALVLPKAGGEDVKGLLVQLSRARQETRVFTTPRTVGEDVEAMTNAARQAPLAQTPPPLQAVDALRPSPTDGVRPPPPPVEPPKPRQSL